MNIGFANGVFDVFHDGHRHFLGKAAELCDYLVVAVNSDESVERLKGPTRPIWSLPARMSSVHGYLNRVHRNHAVIPFEGDEGPLLMAIRPAVLFKGYDHSAAPLFYRRIGWKDGEDPAFEGPRIVQIDQVPGFSTTALLEATHAPD
jgi:D-beta-D-heptose 7-phosphate kinase / D-beta-D-heptose 1-phosphate adenosyltransferase